MLRSLGLGSDDDVEGILELFRRTRCWFVGGYGTHEVGDGKLADGGDEATVGDTEFGETGRAIGVNAPRLTGIVAELAG